MKIGKPKRKVRVVPRETEAPIPQERPAPRKAPQEEEREKVPADG